MELREGHTVRVECKECQFATVVDSDDERLPGEVIIAHGRETGHKSVVEDLDA